MNNVNIELIEQMRLAAANESPKAALLVLKAGLTTNENPGVDYLPAIRHIKSAFPFVRLLHAEQLVHWHELGSMLIG